MRAPISIVIPTLNAAADLPAALGALGDGLKAGLIKELIITDGGSTDKTHQIAEEAGAVWVTGAAGRGTQLAKGIEAARGEWLLIVHADTILGENWANAALNYIANSPGKAGYFKLRFRANGWMPRLVAHWANLRSRWFRLPYGDQGLLLSRELYDAVGGFQKIPLMEDVAMARALRGRLIQLDAVAYTSAAKYQAQGWWRRGARNLWTLLRYFCGVRPDRLARDYRK